MHVKMRLKLFLSGTECRAGYVSSMWMLTTKQSARLLRTLDRRQQLVVTLPPTFICADCADPGDPGLGGLLHCGSDGEAGSGGPGPVRSARHHQHCGQPASDRRYSELLPARL